MPLKYLTILHSSEPSVHAQKSEHAHWAQSTQSLLRREWHLSHPPNQCSECRTPVQTSCNALCLESCMRVRDRFPSLPSCTLTCVCPNIRFAHASDSQWLASEMLCTCTNVHTCAGQGWCTGVPYQAMQTLVTPLDMPLSISREDIGGFN